MASRRCAAARTCGAAPPRIRRKVRLYDARHARLSWMANNGVPDTVVSAWAGHSDLGFTKRTYVHPDPQSLRAGSEKLAELLGRP